MHCLSKVNDCLLLHKIDNITYMPLYYIYRAYIQTTILARPFFVIVINDFIGTLNNDF